MPSQTCYVPGCKNGYLLNYRGKKHGMEPVSLFRPHQDVIDKWNKIIQRKDRKLQKNDIVCALHFKEEDIEYYYSHLIDGKVVLIKRGYPKLKPGALPCFIQTERGFDKKALRRYRTICEQQQTSETSSSIEERNPCDPSSEEMGSSQINTNKDHRKDTHNQKTDLMCNSDDDDDSDFEDASFKAENKDMEDTTSKICEVPILQIQNAELRFNEETSSFSYYDLLQEINDISLPSTLWAVHKHPLDRFIAFDHVTFNPETGVKFDKGVIFEESCTPVIMIHEYNVPIPHLNKDITCIQDVSDLLSELDEFRPVCLLTESPEEYVIPLAN